MLRTSIYSKQAKIEHKNKDHKNQEGCGIEK